MTLTKEMRADIRDSVFRFEAQNQFVEGKDDAVSGIQLRIAQADLDYEGRRMEMELDVLWFTKEELLDLAEAIQAAAHSLLPSKKEV